MARTSSRSAASSAPVAEQAPVRVDPLLDPSVPVDKVLATDEHDPRDFDFERYVAAGRPMYLRADAVEQHRAAAQATTKSEG